MGRLVTATQPRRAIFDLGHLDDLSDVPSLILLVSERTLYMLENLAALDLADMTRYANTFVPQGYIALTPDDSDTSLFEEIRDNAQLEVLELSVDFQTLLENIDKRSGVWDAFSLAGTHTQGGTPGDATLSLTACPSGKLWQVTLITSGIFAGTYTNHLVQIFRYPSSNQTIQNFNAGTTGQYYPVSCNVWLGPGDYIRALFYGLSAGAQVGLWASVAEYVYSNVS